MSRTAHHIPHHHRDATCGNHACDATEDLRILLALRLRTCSFPGPGHVIDDLRYSARTLADAARTGIRPVPSPVRASLPRYAHRSRTFGKKAVAEYAAQDEGAARARTRVELAAARGLFNAHLRAGDLDAYEATDDLDLAPIRHRHNGRWQA